MNVEPGDLFVPKKRSRLLRQEQAFMIVSVEREDPNKRVLTCGALSCYDTSFSHLCFFIKDDGSVAVNTEDWTIVRDE